MGDVLMAHVTIEWTANLEDELDVRSLMELVASDMRDRADGAFPVGGIRVRSYRVDEYVIADGADPGDAFVNLDVKIGAGRPAAFRDSYFEALFARLRASLADLFDRRAVALSMYVSEVDGWKYNNIHQRLVGKS